MGPMHITFFSDYVTANLLLSMSVKDYFGSQSVFDTVMTENW